MQPAGSGLTRGSAHGCGGGSRFFAWRREQLPFAGRFAETAVAAFTALELAAARPNRDRPVRGWTRPSTDIPFRRLKSRYPREGDASDPPARNELSPTLYRYVRMGTVNRPSSMPASVVLRTNTPGAEGFKAATCSLPSGLAKSPTNIRRRADVRRRRWPRRGSWCGGAGGATRYGSSSYLKCGIVRSRRRENLGSAGCLEGKQCLRDVKVVTGYRFVTRRGSGPNHRRNVCFTVTSGISRYLYGVIPGGRCGDYRRTEARRVAHGSLDMVGSRPQAGGGLCDRLFGGTPYRDAKAVAGRGVAITHGIPGAVEGG